MSYNEVSKKSTIKYIKTKQKRVYLTIRKEDYEKIIEPAVAKSGLRLITFIKQAIYEKIERDGLLNDASEKKD